MNLGSDVRCGEARDVRDLRGPFAFEVQQYDLAIERFQLMDQIKQPRCRKRRVRVHPPVDRRDFDVQSLQCDQAFRAARRLRIT